MQNCQGGKRVKDHFECNLAHEIIGIKKIKTSTVLATFKNSETPWNRMKDAFCNIC